MQNSHDESSRPAYRYVTPIILVALALVVAACSNSHHDVPSSSISSSGTGAAPIKPSVMPTSRPSQPVSADRFETPDGKIRCYNTLLYMGSGNNEYGLWCFADNNGSDYVDCRSSPGPAVMHMPIDGQPVYFQCSGGTVNENISKQGKIVTAPAGSVVDIGATTCHVDAKGTSLLCAGPIGYGFSISSTEGSIPNFYNNCNITDTAISCPNPGGRPVS